ncbi:hypothetical protein IEQ34_011166 [Dendrobium chrysotoxum]|uniref:Uncharacterized protein n=1 Tax=Dendrobium chrysotoxum TaxID=161865 RepID=A0AAV7GXX0_DENCH|nr:hypothetical protein IEQ34_011166 [Dendrobium chrysotoxum]
MEVGKTKEDLAGNSGDGGFRERESTAGEKGFKGSGVHELKKKGSVTGGRGDDAVAMNYGGGIGAAEDFNLACDLSSADGVVGCQRLEGVYGSRSAVADLIDCSSISMAKDLDLFKVGEPVLAAGRNGGSRQSGNLLARR